MARFEGRGCAIRIEELDRSAQPGRLFVSARARAPADFIHLSITEEERLAGLSHLQVDVDDGRRDDDLFCL